MIEFCSKSLFLSERGGNDVENWITCINERQENAACSK
jgi:hypothetical protein